jgi:hypothetical protein
MQPIPPHYQYGRIDPNGRVIYEAVPTSVSSLESIYQSIVLFASSPLGIVVCTVVGIVLFRLYSDYVVALLKTLFGKVAGIFSSSGSSTTKPMCVVVVDANGKPINLYAPLAPALDDQQQPQQPGLADGSNIPADPNQQLRSRYVRQ